MKTIVAIAASLCGIALASQAMCSPYPSNYGNQIVRVTAQGPALFANVGGGGTHFQVIGYKASGFLASANPESIDAVVSATCGRDTRITTVRLGREWNGTGYMSSEHSFFDYLPQGCFDPNVTIGVAFTANGQWDSLGGANYTYVGESFSGSSAIEISTSQAGNGHVAPAAWDVIVNEMKR